MNNTKPLTPQRLRELIHQNPELSLAETETTQLLSEQVNLLLAEYPLARPLVHSERPLATGLVVCYLGDSKGREAPYWLFRADIDALPIKEQTATNTCAYPSQNDSMHACGHDVHTAILYGHLKAVLAKVGTAEEVKRNLIFLFQPGEEEGAGALKVLQQCKLIKDLLHQSAIERAYALHVSDEYLLGEVASNDHTLFASALAFDLDIKGLSSHLAFPERAHNAFTCLRFFLNEIEEVLQKREDFKNILWGYGRIESGRVRNILPDFAHLEGSIRTLTMLEAVSFFNYLKTRLKGHCQETSTTGTIKEISFYPPVTNNKKLFAEMKNIFDSVDGDHQEDKCQIKVLTCETKRTGEDFGYFSEVIPTLMVWLGTRTHAEEEIKGLHHPQFFPAADSIDYGIYYLGKLLWP